MTEPNPDDFTNFVVKYARRWRREGQFEYAVQVAEWHADEEIGGAGLGEDQ